MLGEIAELDYVLPKQYNQEFTMTRYFHYEYKKLEQFLTLKKAEYLFEEKPADGKIIALTDADKTTDMEKVQQHLKELKDERVVVLIPREPLMEEENIRRLIAVRQLKEDKTFLEENAVLQQELQLYEEDLIYEINAALEKRYLPENGNCTVLCGIVSRNKSKSVGEFNRTLSRICEEYYNLTPKINNEMINRRKVSSQTKRARRTIVDAVLNGKEMAQWENGSAAEATIYRATLRALDEGRAEEGNQQVLQEIMEYINRCAGKKHSFSELYESLSGKGYGVREGIIPIYIARQIAELEDTPVILLQEREVEITPEIFDNIEEHPENYSLYVEKETVNKEKYIKRLEEIFCGQDTYQSKVPLTSLKLKDDEIVNYYNKESDMLLYNALKRQLQLYSNDAEKAFAQPFHKPKADGTQGPVVKKVKVIDKQSSGVYVHEGKGITANGDMIRIDIFRENGKYYFVPIYAADVVKKVLPNKSPSRGKSGWIEMKDENFVFSLYPKDLIHVKTKKEDGLKLNLVNGGQIKAQEAVVYYTGADVSKGSIDCSASDKKFKLRGLGIQSLIIFEKCQVDVLGNISVVKHEKRMDFSAKKR